MLASLSRNVLALVLSGPWMASALLHSTPRGCLSTFNTTWATDLNVCPTSDVAYVGFKLQYDIQACLNIDIYAALGNSNDSRNAANLIGGAAASSQSSIASSASSAATTTVGSTTAQSSSATGAATSAASSTASSASSRASSASSAASSTTGGASSAVSSRVASASSAASSAVAGASSAVSSAAAAATSPASAGHVNGVKLGAVALALVGGAAAML